MAHLYTATVRWEREGQVFTDRRYSRAHQWSFDGGISVPASSSPLVVRLPLSKAEAVDPEEAFVASLSSCHMLFFLDFASRAEITVDSYVDEAVGEMGKDERGRIFVARVTLRPQLTISGDKRPSAEEIAALHHQSHEACFIASSVKSEVAVEAPPPAFA